MKLEVFQVCIKNSNNLPMIFHKIYIDTYEYKHVGKSKSKSKRGRENNTSTQNVLILRII